MFEKGTVDRYFFLSPFPSSSIDKIERNEQNYYGIPGENNRSREGSGCGTVAVIRDNERRRGWMANKSVGKSSLERPMIRASLSISISISISVSVPRDNRAQEGSIDDGLIIGRESFLPKILLVSKTIIIFNDKLLLFFAGRLGNCSPRCVTRCN